MLWNMINFSETCIIASSVRNIISIQILRSSFSYCNMQTSEEVFKLILIASKIINTSFAQHSFNSDLGVCKKRGHLIRNKTFDKNF